MEVEMAPHTTLVLGGTGKTGRRVAERLWDRGLPVRLGSRAGTPRFDWAAPETWPATVLLSGRGEPEAQRCEQLVGASGAEWTLVRANWFSQNFSENYLLEPVLAGEVALPVGEIGEPFVDADDIADVAVAALTEDGHAGQLYELTGPRLWTFADAVAEIARVTRREIRYVQVPIEAYVAALESAQLPPELVTLIRYLFTEVLDGRNASLADGVRRALGRPPRDFADYVQQTAATGIWDAGAATAHGVAPAVAAS
jgi:uncharacterized protein YbjT (DUF2867 family)